MTNIATIRILVAALALAGYKPRCYGMRRGILWLSKADSREDIGIALESSDVDAVVGPHPQDFYRALESFA